MKRVPTYCYQCVAGPDLLTVGESTARPARVEPNFGAAGVHPGGGKVCVKAYGLVQKTYHPGRVLRPMKRTNPKKGHDEDPGFVPISWDEALGLIAQKLDAVKEAGLLDESGYPRVAASFGGGGTPQSYMGSFPGVPRRLGAGGHGLRLRPGREVLSLRAPLRRALASRLHRVARYPAHQLPHLLRRERRGLGRRRGRLATRQCAQRGMKRVQVEPHLSVTGACSAEWVPIKPKTDAAFLYALIHVMLHEAPRERLDVAFLFKHEPPRPTSWASTGSTCASPRPARRSSPRPLEGKETHVAVEIGADGEVLGEGRLEGETAFAKLVAHMKPYSPEWAASICDVKAERIRRIANEFLDAACVGQTIDIEGRTLPYRPVAVSLGKTVTNGWGGFECCWARTLLAALVGALEVPGGIHRHHGPAERPMSQRLAARSQGPDGLMNYPLQPDRQGALVGADRTSATPTGRWCRSPAMAPGARRSAPRTFRGCSSTARPRACPRVTFPDVWFVYRTNPAISFWDTQSIADKMARFPFVVCFAYTRDETNHFADMLLPDATDLESLQLIRIGGTKYVEQFWDHEGYALRQPAIDPRGEARDFTDIATELAERTGLTRAVQRGSINKRRARRALGRSPRLLARSDSVCTREEIWDAVCRAASSELTDGAEAHGLAWWKEHGIATRPFPRTDWYLYPTIASKGLRFELPYQERLLRVGTELGRRLHENDMNWWDAQIAEYQALPVWKDFPGIQRRRRRRPSAGSRSGS
jgi:phenylacetyl-CoA:acceptor oxidoreductase